MRNKAVLHLDAFTSSTCYYARQDAAKGFLNGLDLGYADFSVLYVQSYPLTPSKTFDLFCLANFLLV